MIRAAFAAPFAAAMLALAAAPAAAAPAPTPESATRTAQGAGLSIEAVRAWLTANGGEVSEIRRQGGQTWIGVDEDEPLAWLIFFYDCQADVCSNLQFTVPFSTPAITPALVNDWNRNQRFLKAVFVPAEAGGGDATALGQYDVLIAGGDVEQLVPHTALWLNLARAFGETVGYLAPAE